ncbi:hypothetical protein KBTX_04395 [wastewater metagenome]|uniref:Uncharacterized protein n=2 Tax=unclassified sequences TaxID=12908 RepID=A0A5B8RLV5_9ZZZZ|nr:hypothetical protein KBTEX_04395 [uncultured organism]
MPRQGQIVGDAELGRLRLQRPALAAVAEDHQPRRAPGAQPRERAQQRGEVLLPGQPPGTEDHRRAGLAQPRMVRLGARLLGEIR